jgi:16S rRNA (guanine966-N2)-methyltransferase
MRITGGQTKGRLLANPKGQNIRPTSDRVREAIFNIIGQDLSGVKVLDLFAGTGSLGLEALSRGALQALFIDNSPQSLRLIRKNLALCGFQDSGFVVRRDLRKGIILTRALEGELFDLVFLDPPYGKNLIPLLLEELSRKGLLSSEARVIAESSKTEGLPVAMGNLHTVDTRLYGDTKISLYAYEVTQ